MKFCSLSLPSLFCCLKAKLGIELHLRDFEALRKAVSAIHTNLGDSLIKKGQSRFCCHARYAER